jgi:hypothetical protein
MGYSLLLFALLCGGGYYLFDHNQIILSQFTIASIVILLLGNLILYILDKKKITKNIINQETV